MDQGFSARESTERLRSAFSWGLGRIPNPSSRWGSPGLSSGSVLSVCHHGIGDFPDAKHGCFTDKKTGFPPIYTQRL